MNSHTNTLFYPERNYRDGRITLFSSHSNFSRRTSRLVKKYSFLQSELYPVSRLLEDINKIVDSEYFEKAKAEGLVNKIQRDEKRILNLQNQNKILIKEVRGLKRIMKILRINTSESYKELYSNGGIKNGK